MHLPAHLTHLVAATLLRTATESVGTTLVLLVLARTGRAAPAGYLIAAIMLPYVLAGPFVGDLLDRVRRTRVFTTTLTAVNACALAVLLTVAGRVPIPLAMVVAVAVGVTGPLIVALTSLLPRSSLPNA